MAVLKILRGHTLNYCALSGQIKVAQNSDPSAKCILKGSRETLHRHALPVTMCQEVCNWEYD